MIGSLRGRLISKRPEAVIVEASGVGYELHVPVNTLADLPDEDSEVFLHVYTHVRDDAILLFGFKDLEEKRVFITLLGVTGIGPRMALNILSGISHKELLSAIDSEDVTHLTKVPGLGKKTAHRLILELKEKLPKLEEAPADRLYGDTLSALVNLGYKKADASQALEKARQKGYNNIEDLLKEALKFLTGSSD